MLSSSSVLLALTASASAQVISGSCQCGRAVEERIQVRLHNQDTAHNEDWREIYFALYSKTKVIGGTEAEKYEFPWAAFIRVKTRKGAVRCGGTLINDRSEETRLEILVN